MRRKPDPTIMGFRKSKPIRYWVEDNGDHMVEYMGLALAFRTRVAAQAWCNSKWKGIKLKEAQENVG